MEELNKNNKSSEEIEEFIPEEADFITDDNIDLTPKKERKIIKKSKKLEKIMQEEGLTEIEVYQKYGDIDGQFSNTTPQEEYEDGNEEYDEEYEEIEEKAALIAAQGKEVLRLEQRISGIAAGNAGSGQKDDGHNGTCADTGRNPGDIRGDAERRREEQHPKLLDGVPA